MSEQEKGGVGGTREARTDAWRTFADALGDDPATTVCEWADLCKDPHAAVAGALSVLRLCGPGQDYTTALNVHMMNVDMDAYIRAWSAENAYLFAPP